MSVGLTERVREHACLGHRQSDTLVVNGKRWVCVEVRERERERDRKSVYRFFFILRFLYRSISLSLSLSLYLYLDLEHVNVASTIGIRH